MTITRVNGKIVTTKTAVQYFDTAGDLITITAIGIGDIDSKTAYPRVLQKAPDNAVKYKLVKTETNHHGRISKRSHFTALTYRRKLPVS